ncbi:hypothetical protein Back2_09800 [Nocardioides baekrokdamisoli]|uniref:Cyclic nucleotide-binding domain-containing protein n=1 Tax=Nocardioides baekrokdamisoli TaxID=1804624 RepID=A0A3G9IWG4_9ACTN|nr:hypothetical protein [Nocardioides baekrokdamisoli]BBH16693.1 hypothetical protein Back2_09800 [Nocardioides baekrokdamisoli]
MDHRHDYEITDRDAHFAGLLTRRQYHPRLSRSEKSELARQLSGHPLLAGMTASEISGLIAASHAFVYPEHWTISAQSSCSDMCFLILEGEVAMSRNHEDVRLVGPGDVIGLADAAHHHVHHEAAVSQTRVTGVAVDSEPLLAVLGAHAPAPVREGALAAAYAPAGVAVS